MHHASIISIHAPRTGSDGKVCADSARYGYFNPRSPHGERHFSGEPFLIMSSISIHAPRTGSDSQVACASCFPSPSFQSTLPARGATRRSRSSRSRSPNFNPRSPHGERPQACQRGIMRLVFQSTLPARGATVPRHRRCDERVISIHAPRTGSDTSGSREPAGRKHFNPRSPHGERQAGRISESVE